MTPTLQTVTPGSLSHGYLDRTLGVFFIGYIFCLTLYGFTFFQTYTYFSRYPNDHILLRLTVATLCALDTASSALISHALYYYLVKLFPFTQTIEYAPNTFCAHFITTIIAVYLSQIFYSHRVLTITRGYAVTGVIVFFSTVGCVFGLATSGKLLANRAFGDLSRSTPMALSSITQGASALSALFIFVAMNYTLRPALMPGLKPLNLIWDRWVAFLVSRAGAATAFQFACFISFVIAPSRIYWIFFHLISTKLFVVSALTALNCREVVNGHGINEEDASQTMPISSASTNTSAHSAQLDNIHFQRPGNITIEITRTVHSDAATKPSPYNIEENDSGVFSSVKRVASY